MASPAHVQPSQWLAHNVVKPAIGQSRPLPDQRMASPAHDERNPFRAYPTARLTHDESVSWTASGQSI
jgi:hypothetical protein